LGNNQVDFQLHRFTMSKKNTQTAPQSLARFEGHFDAGEKGGEGKEGRGREGRKGTEVTGDNTLAPK